MRSARSLSIIVCALSRSTRFTASSDTGLPPSFCRCCFARSLWFTARHRFFPFIAISFSCRRPTASITASPPSPPSPSAGSIALHPSRAPASRGLHVRTKTTNSSHVTVPLPSASIAAISVGSESPGTSSASSGEMAMNSSSSRKPSPEESK